MIMGNLGERINNEGSETQVNQLPSTGLTKDPFTDMPFLQGKISRRSLFKGVAVLAGGAFALRPDLSRAQEQQPFKYEFKWVVTETDRAKKDDFIKEVQKADAVLTAYTEIAAKIGDPLASVVRRFGDLDRARILNPGQKPERNVLLYLTPSYKTGEIPEHLRDEPVVYQLFVSEKLGIIAHQIFVHSSALDLDINAPDKIDPLLAIAVTVNRVDLTDAYATQQLNLGVPLSELKLRAENPDFYTQSGQVAKPRVAKIYQQVYPFLTPLGISPSLTYPGPDLSEGTLPVALEESSE